MKILKVLYVLPVKGGGGGAHSVAQEVNHLNRIGVNASIAVNEKNFESFTTKYCDLVYLQNRVLPFTDIKQLVNLLQSCDVVVCTIFTSVSIVKQAVALVKGKKPRVAYYIQDYEPLFCDPSEELHREAINSYSSIPGSLLFAKTDWIRDIVTRNHGIEVRKVKPSLDTELYYPYAGRTYGKIRVAAMVRPSTPRRAPLRTMQVLKEIKEKYADRVHVNIFGCNDIDLYNNQLPSDFVFNNHGVLERKQVASLLRNCTVFMDLSDYQAFGRTGLESMACGCVPFLPVFGGVYEYAEHDVNSLLVDSRSTKDIFEKFDYFMSLSESEKCNLAQSGIETSQNYSIGSAAYSKLKLFEELVAA